MFWVKTQNVFLFLILIQGYVLIVFKREREKEGERNTHQLLPVHAPTRHWACNLLVYRTPLQPTEPPGQDPKCISYCLRNTTLSLMFLTCATISSWKTGTLGASWVNSWPWLKYLVNDEAYACFPPLKQEQMPQPTASFKYEELRGTGLA